MDLIPPRITKAVSTAHHDACNPWSDVECFVNHRRNGVCLDHVPDAECGNRCQNGEDDSEPFLFHPSLENVHRTSGHPPSFGYDAVFHGENCFGIFCGDAEDAGQPHPKHCTGPASGDGCRDANDVARADGGCQRSR
jgi:hypothetical protein